MKRREMKRLAIVLAPILILALVLIAVGCCDGDEDPTPTPSPSPTAPLPTATTPPTPSTTPTPASTPTSAVTPTPGPIFPPITSLPCRFHGTVRLDGAEVSDGTVITATIEGEIHTITTPAPAVYGPSTYAIKIAPLGDTPYNDGTAIIFMIGDYTAAQTGTWVAGGNVELNLTASAT